MTLTLYALSGFLLLLFVPLLGGFLVELLRSLIEGIENVIGIDALLLLLSGSLVFLLLAIPFSAFYGAWEFAGCLALMFCILIRVYSGE